MKRDPIADFEVQHHPPLNGMLTRYNKKTVTVITEDGGHWNVSPSLLRKVESVEDARGRVANVIPIYKK